MPNERTSSSDYSPIRYLTCQKCGRSLRVRKDGTFPDHREPRVYRSQHHKLNKCSASGSHP